MRISDWSSDVCSSDLTDDEFKAIAATKQMMDGPNDEGEMFERPAKPSDRFVSPFPNDAAARTANGGALPPDLSLIVDARAGGADYLYGVLVGYKAAPAAVPVPDGLYYHTGFAGPPLARKHGREGKSVAER